MFGSPVNTSTEYSGADNQTSAGWGAGGAGELGSRRGGPCLQGVAVMMNPFQWPWALQPALHSMSSSQESVGGPVPPG